MEVARDGADREAVWRGEVDAGRHDVPPGRAAPPAAAGRPPVTIPVGANWRSGYYAVTVTAGDERADAFLVVRPEPGAPRAPILLVLSTCTWNAYNDWGGPSLYTGGHQVSFERPLAPGFLVKPEPHERKAQTVPDREALGFFRWAEPNGVSRWSGGAGWWNWERTALRWAEANGFAVDVAIQQDLEDVPGLLDGVRLLPVGRPRRVLDVGDARGVRRPHRGRRQRRDLLSGTPATGRSGSTTTGGR